MAETLLYAPAPAKINLFLKVTARRSDGYHELESLFLPLAVPADDIAIDLEALPGAITVGSSDIMLPGGTNNIAGKAAESWAKKSAVMPHWDINIVKNIPVAAGLGGGSSDAAAVLKLLNDHAGKPLNDEALHSAALELGADVPFFLEPVPSVMTGIGEKSAPLDFALPELHILLLAPGFPVSAAEGYRLLMSNSIAPMSETLREKIIDSLRRGDVETFAGLLFNDLQKGVCNKYPVLDLLLSDMKSSGALNAVMSGSGPTLFALYKDAETLEKARKTLQEKYPEFQVIPAEVLQ